MDFEFSNGSFQNQQNHVDSDEVKCVVPTSQTDDYGDDVNGI